MKLWSRLVVGSLVLALAFSFGMSPASAASKKKKKKEETKREERHETRHSYSKKVIDGLNMQAKPGYFFADSADTLRKNQIAGALHLTFDSGFGNALSVPFGGSYGITDKLLVNVNTTFYTYSEPSITAFGQTVGGGSISGLSYLNFGGKYGFGNVLKNSDSTLKIAAGLDFAIGPLSNNGGSAQFGFDPYGVATLTLPDGLQFNGRLGIFVTNWSSSSPNPLYYAGGPYPPTITVSASYSYFQLDLGAAYPFDKDLTGIAELATNGVYGFGANGGTPLIVGLRTGHDVQLQGMLGLDLGVNTGFFIGGGVALFSE